MKHHQSDQQALFELEAEELAFVFLKIHSCSDVADHWHPDWYRCPLCLEFLSEDGVLIHKDLESILN